MPAGFVASACAICGPGTGSAELYPATFGVEHLTAAVFSARRLPDRVHYRVVRCDACGLVRSDPVAGGEVLAALYVESTFDYVAETENLKRTYGRYLARLDGHRAGHGALLEIGCGNGFFLERALEMGYRSVAGVEPSHAAVESARADIGPVVVRDLMREGLFMEGSFDVVCLFQVFDHVPDPRALLRAVHLALRPGGLLLVLNHDVESRSARLLKDRSPIIDIEHTYLYSRRTLRRILELEGFDVVESGGVSNTYSARYLARLLPLPAGIKRALLDVLGRTPIGRLRASVPLGNLYAVGRRREAGTNPVP